MDDALKLFHFAETGNLNAKKALILLHGTGGSETDLFPIVTPFNKTHRILGLLGNVREHDMARFFERDSDGVFNQASIREEVDKLSLFLREWLSLHSIKAEDLCYIGYSNGGNMILALLFTHPELVRSAGILHSMLPYPPGVSLDLSKHQIFVSWDDADLIISSVLSKELIDTLERHLAQLRKVRTDNGHHLTQDEVVQLHEFIQNT